MELDVGIQIGIAKMYFTNYRNMLNSKFSLLFKVIQFMIIGRGLGQSQADPSRMPRIATSTSVRKQEEGDGILGEAA